jgi:NAD+ kinase
MAVMEQRMNSPRRSGILVHPSMDTAEALADDIRSHLIAHDLEVRVGDFGQSDFTDWVRQGDADLLIALGGDGTMLRAGELSAQGETPVLGINLGRIGFLMEVTRDDWKQGLDRVLEGDCWLEDRMRLAISLLRQGEVIGRWEALNEAVVGRGRTARPLRIKAQVDGRTLASYVADALICATATGSTAYALAAGGPILPPRLRNMLLVPVAPHFSVDRGLVLPVGSEVKLEIESRHEADVSSDGMVQHSLHQGDIVRVVTSDRDAVFVRLKDPGYFFHNLTTYLSRSAANT